MTRQEALGVALTKNAGHSVRSEDVRNYEELFVDPFNSDSITTNANQLIVGRRGSGKTMLLGALRERINAQFPGRPVSAFYYSAVSFRSSAEFGGLRPSVKEKTHAFFHSFIEKLANDILLLADQVFYSPDLLETLGLTGEDKRVKRELIADRVLQLVDAASIGVERSDPAAVHRSVDSVQTKDGKRGAGASAQFGTTRDFGAKAFVDMSSSGTRTSKVHGTLEPIRVFDPSRVRALLVETIELLGLDYIVIFLDEWMSLAECQVEFAERLRQCLFGESRIGVKIAADQYQGQFNNAGIGHKFRGLEVGADIFVEVDLDKPFRDPAQAGGLLTQVLYRRLNYLNPLLVDWYGAPPLDGNSRFVGDLFETAYAFEELVRGAQGLCRDFHEIFQDCSKAAGFGRRKVNVNTVREVMIERTSETYDRVLAAVDSNPLLRDLIIPHVRMTEERYFFVEKKDTRHAAIVDDLISKRFVHLVPLERMHPDLKVSYRLLEIDYGIYLDLMRAKAFTSPPRAPGRQMDPMSVDLDNVAPAFGLRRAGTCDQV